MQSHKMLLEVEDEHFYLIALYASLEGYKMAFSINKYLRVKLERDRRDIDFNHTDFHAVYALYSYKDPNAYYSLDLVANKFKGKPRKILNSGSLFEEEELSPQEVYLIPEYNKVDYFLKISEEIQQKEFNRILAKIGQIPGVQAAYAIDVNNLKSKQNLIFE
ncbi:IPExxxVDY family protein [Gramella jeungdoensis]|uniref:IPExxxVDY family protein n=1 Tax=Gramella jeungdoensis TaxID=708091 RepID=A0ABT0Z1Z8_9FLAO|nr:IPExxxVDY family protein [Gramella jeungdoensis]MCM8569750.1 IPExxxVDY family protein [Gramella jeungdoensis]